MDWKVKDWQKNTLSGIRSNVDKFVVRDSIFENIGHGITSEGQFALIEKNLINKFTKDGIRGLGAHSVYQHNIVKNSVQIDDHHNDGFQSWSIGSDRKAGTGIIQDVVLRSNIFIEYEDEDAPYTTKSTGLGSGLQGIGLFDGFYEDWVIENNVVMVNSWHGITIAGFKNCKIFNNTVVDLKFGKPGPARIMLSDHKRLGSSQGCIVRNNLSSDMKLPKNRGIIEDHNYVGLEINRMFVNFFDYDLRLKPDSTAVDSGSAEQTPKFDIDGNPRGPKDLYDLGAYEYIKENSNVD